MIRKDKQLIVVGDRVLVKVGEGEQRTKVGLYLPPTAVDTQAVQGGDIVATGPGSPMPDMGGDPGEEPWRHRAAREARYVPMQARAATTRCSSARRPSRSRSRTSGIWSCRRPPSSRSSASRADDDEDYRLTRACGASALGVRGKQVSARVRATSRHLPAPIPTASEHRYSGDRSPHVSRTDRRPDAPGAHAPRRRGAAHRRRTSTRSCRSTRAPRSWS